MSIVASASELVANSERMRVADELPRKRGYPQREEEMSQCHAA